MNKKALVLLLLYATSLYPAFPKNTIITTQSSFTKIQELSKQTAISSLDLENNQTSTNRLHYLLPVQTSTAYKITLPNTFIICSKDQLFYDPQKNAWIPAKALNTKSCFLDVSGNVVPCLEITKIEFNEPQTFYDISLHKPHTFFVSESQILTHNIIPIAIGLTWAFGQGIALTGAGFGLGALGFGLWQKFGKPKNQITVTQIQKECRAASSGGGPDPDDNDWRKKKVNNMYEFFDQYSVGKNLQKNSQKTKFRVKGQTVWKATKNLKHLNIQKGNLYYLDSLHKDHIEVFCSKGKMPLRTILNLDGSVNLAKIKQAGIRYLSKYIG